MSLTAHIQTVRKLKPFLEAFTALQAIAEVAESSEQTLARNEARLADARLALQSAQADADSARTFAADHVAKAKEEAEIILAKARAALAEAKDQAETIVLDSGSKASAQLADAAELVGKREAEMKALDEAIAAKAAECAALDKRIADARATLRRFAEGQP